MKILITGVAGFIGSNLAEVLLKQGYEVIGIDNMSHGFQRNITNCLLHPSFKFILGDIANPLILKDIKADIVVHLASQKIPRYSNALRTLDENYLMLRNIVSKCVLEKSKLVFASTSDVYGKSNNIPFVEDSDLILGPTKIKRWSYALSKIYGEHYIIANSEQYGLKYTIVRFFGSYGPNQNLSWWGGPQSVFITNSIKKRPLEIHGDGLQTRTFTYISDTIEALVACCLQDKANGEIFNIASFPEEEISIKALAETIWKMVNGYESEPLYEFIPYSNFGRYEDVQRRVPSIEKLKKYFGFSPKIRLREGLAKTIEWQMNIMRTENL